MIPHTGLQLNYIQYSLRYSSTMPIIQSNNVNESANLCLKIRPNNNTNPSKMCFNQKMFNNTYSRNGCLSHRF